MPNLIEFPDKELMAARMADAIAAVLGRAVAERGTARLALSGGSSPAPLYRALSDKDLPWDKVQATLVDERWVPPGAAGSNEDFIRDTLCKGKAAKTSFSGLWRDVPTADEASDLLEQQYKASGPFDVVVMGMGPDGHTASWFPGATGLADLFASDRAMVAAEVPQTEVTGEHTTRLTFTPSALAGAGLTCLMMSGNAKKDVFTEALSGDDALVLPVRKLIAQTPDLWACWAP